jgi:LytS/YehU family sensor histidine kinase
VNQHSSLDVSLRISAEALPHLRQGLTPETAAVIAEIILRVAEVDAVAITDPEVILAFAGEGCPTMRPGGPIQTAATRHAIATGEITFVPSKDELHCPIPGCPCPIHAAVIAPLKLRGTTVGTVKLYSHRPAPIPAYIERLAWGMSQLLSLQLELAEVERYRELLAQARLEALQAQIRPHFLFNTLNTVIATSRTDPDLARALLVELAEFLRHTIGTRDDHAAVAEEIRFVEMYLRLERARLGDRLRVRVQVDESALALPMPVLTLQPLVENAVVHGLAPKRGPGQLTVAVRRRPGHLSVLVVDDGLGIPPARLAGLRARDASRDSGVGLPNVEERLRSLYGPGHGLRIRSRPGRGTAVAFRVPIGNGRGGGPCAC